MRTTRLLRDDVYASLQKVSNLERGVEIALAKIRSDTDLQRTLRQYAKRNEIKDQSFGEYGSGIGTYHRSGDTFRDRRIVFWETPWEDGEGRKHCLYIGPDPNKSTMPIWLRFRHYPDKEDYFAPRFVYTNMRILEKGSGKFYLENVNDDHTSVQMSRMREIAGRRVLDVPFLQDVPAVEFITGLEKALAELVHR